MINQVEVNRGDAAGDVSLLEEIKNVANRIRERAYHLFQSRGGEDGRDLEDWLAAEREVIGASASEMTEDGADYHVRMALPGFGANDVKVWATPNELIVKAESAHGHEETEEKISHSEISASEIFRKFDFPEAVDAGLVTACLEEGVLKIDAKKAVQPKQIGKAA